MSCKLELLITKYDPQYRDENRVYLRWREEWCMYSQIGKTFNGKVFTASEYFDTEDRYIESLKILLRACGISEMKLNQWGNWRILPNHTIFQEVPYPVEKIRPMIAFGDLSDYRDDDSGTEIHIPHQSISEEDVLGWTTWYPIPPWFHTNDRSFSLSNEFIASLRQGRACTIDEIELLSRLCLRGDFGCYFTGPNNSYIHFGWDYYMYFGGDFDCDWPSLKFPDGMFIEAIPTPYHPENDDDDE